MIILMIRIILKTKRRKQSHKNGLTTNNFHVLSNLTSVGLTAGWVVRSHKVPLVGRPIRLLAFFSSFSFVYQLSITQPNQCQGPICVAQFNSMHHVASCSLRSVGGGGGGGGGGAWTTKVCSLTK